ncbi:MULTISPECIES: hypothetical protein [Paenibacillus]|uniref:hypothetical protein n=1 Tax=Paenibacillus TaxID=44249 RepID=UPI00168A6103|nr:MULTISPECIES: hypothetical protein [Paenibacillus]
MDKDQVIHAYRRGLITRKECGQILGVENTQLDRLLLQEEGRHPGPHPGPPVGGS